MNNMADYPMRIFIGDNNNCMCEVPTMLSAI